ncbi:hypothetical protein TSUD_69460 [Trifolium subterraneum]|uniref:Uncharacterized protein n=1 Tax=Trifolium subterraneum TaxID=3900 RepID=A0A2Z6N1G7_TRISU|nr:hypothetical protein TSUD_69460 [Trifolium subterraneum]
MACSIQSSFSVTLTLNCSSCSSSTTYSAATITTLPHRSRYSTCSFAKKSLKKSKREGPEAFVDLSDDKFVQNDKLLDTSLNPPDQNANPIPSRSAVLQACIITSGLIAAFGTVIRQVSHVASIEGLPILDCSTEVSLPVENKTELVSCVGFEMWHLGLITGLVVLISSSRYLLLKIWPEFAESSEAANRQVLSSLQPLDYTVVAFLPGISEELLFRGAILPLLGMDWKSIGVAASIFGVLHLGNGRKYSFVIWATFVGLAYGYATVLSSSIAVPMASHAYEQQGGKPLPKFGEWDVNDPASAEGFTVIFNKARDDKKTGGGGSVRINSQRRSNSRKEEDKSSKKKWFCFKP